ncbi:hypothetical protein AA0116_g3909 [Alternaria tenuissima]|uniref:SRR1-like domain-containing protein n=1 Tax=Alternaria tenuissima TaxID=119927 RepID=A0AB37WI93_9PLEO|nr:hypothetical protein AA0115_g6594 [Alternaria tenuissima]RYO64064.1 hypothetical protein AA0116_g3909 [Alternaria tenuissima]
MTPATFMPTSKSPRRNGNANQPGTILPIYPRTINSQHSFWMSLSSVRKTSIKLTADVIDGLRNLSVVGDNSGEGIDDEENTNSDLLDDPDEEDLEIVFGYPVDLIAQENQHRRRPIYTRGLLNDVKLCVDQIREGFSIGPAQRDSQNLYGYGLNHNSYKIWRLDNNNLNSNFIQVEYLSRVEMHPEFQHRYGIHSDQIRALREYNKDSKNDCIDTPYTFITFDRQYLNEHQNTAKIQEYWAAMMHTKRLWKESSSRRKLREEFEETAKRCAPITQVVCFGLGALNLNKKFYHSAIQYMAVFSIIQTLNEFYRQTDSNRPAIKLVLQDPNYEIKDHQILKRLSNDGDNISFVSDPEGLLAIDAGTLVVTAFLPVQMPLVQIVADLFSKDPTEGPAAIICDIMTVDVEKREYSLSDRASPAVARFLTNHYERAEDGFDDHGLEDELMADAYGDDWENRFYWLNWMDLWVRRIDTN